MAVLFPVSGARLYVGQVMVDQDEDFVEADFISQSWLEIGGLTNIGELGDEATLITAEIINAGRTKKAKGTSNAGAMAIVAAHDPNDPGQAELVVAQKEVNNRAFRLVFNDAPEGGSPSERLYLGMTMTARNVLNEANNFIQFISTIEINSNVVKIDASA
jgi:hypothetical protein